MGPVDSQPDASAYESPMKTLYVKNRGEWRAWLHKNAKTAGDIWLVYYKKNSGKPSPAYEDTVEEALCFGWIDGKIRRIDESRCARRFTPRKPQSPWSGTNIQRARRMIAAGKMTRAALNAFRSEPRRETPAIPLRLPGGLQKQFKAHSDAWEHFQRFPPYYRRMTIGWVASARKPETREKRLSQLIEFSARNKRIEFM